MARVGCPSCKKKLSPLASSCPHCGHPLREGWAREAKRKNRSRLVIGLIGWGIIVWIFAYVLGDDSGSPVASTPEVKEQSALDKMELVFIGEHPRGEIIRRLNRAMQVHKVPLTEENYSRVGSVLVGMRKETGVPEMDILQCVGAANIGRYADIPEAAAICATSLER